MNICLIGGNGYIGEFLKRRLSRIKGINHIYIVDKCENDDILYLDLEHTDDFDTTLLDGMDYIIFLAAVSSPDLCAQEYDSSWRINVKGTSDIIRIALEKSIRVLFFSSDAVFGKDEGIFDEISSTECMTAYGRMKKAVEDEFRNNHGFKAVRLSYVVSLTDRFIRYCLSCIAKDEEAQVFHPFYRNCITVTNVVDAIVWLLQHWDEFPDWVLNIAGPELVSRLRLADELNRIMGNKLKYSIVKPEEVFYKNRPAITQMKSRYLYKMGILADKSFTEFFRNEMMEIEL